MAHVVVGVAVVTPLAVHVGFRAWGRSAGLRPLARAGLALAGGVGVQLLLGLASFALTATGRPANGVVVLVTTAHQWLGAILLALAVTIATHYFRLDFASRPCVPAPVTFSG
jgi:hypothetical protein